MASLYTIYFFFSKKKEKKKKEKKIKIETQNSLVTGAATMEFQRVVAVQPAERRSSAASAIVMTVAICALVAVATRTVCI